MNKAQRIICRIHDLVIQLEELYPSRHFTLDGHLVGSLGEVVAAEMYELELFETNYPVHDAKTRDGRLVQIKTTQRSSIGISECPKCLIVLQLDANGSFEEVYNGPGRRVWNAAGKMQKNGQRRISLSKLKALAEKVEPEKKIPLV